MYNRNKYFIIQDDDNIYFSLYKMIYNDNKHS